MKIKDLIKELSLYNKELPICFFMVYNNGASCAYSNKADIGLDADGNELYIYCKECE